MIATSFTLDLHSPGLFLRYIPGQVSDCWWDSRQVLDTLVGSLLKGKTEHTAPSGLGELNPQKHQRLSPTQPTKIAPRSQTQFGKVITVPFVELLLNSHISTNTNKQHGRHEASFFRQTPQGTQSSLPLHRSHTTRIIRGREDEKYYYSRRCC